MNEVSSVPAGRPVVECSWALKHRPQCLKDVALDPADRRLLERMRASGALQHIVETLRYLRDNPECSERGMFEHVLVDEFQDFNKAEQELLELLAEGSAYTIVGDEDQSIYTTLKFAHPDGIGLFHETHPGTYDEGLVDCRRCPRLVVALANHLIQHNTTRTARALNPWDANPEGEVIVVQWPTRHREAIGLSQFIRERIETTDVQPGDVLVLTPSRQFGYAIRDNLKAVSIPAVSFFHEEVLDGTPKKLERCQAQQAFALLTLLAKPDDRVALRAWCGFGSSTLAASAWRRVLNHLEDADTSPRRVLQEIVDGTLALPYTGSIVERFELLLQREQELGELTGQVLLDALFSPDADWAETCRELATQLGETDFGADTLRETLRVGITQPERPSEADYVRVMSLHRSKGLSAEMVIVAGCIDGVLPRIDEGRSPTERTRQLEEQRRLFYVAITRCRRVLVLSSMLRIERRLVLRIGARVLGGDYMYANTIASRYLDELGPERPDAIRGRDLVDLP